MARGLAISLQRIAIGMLLGAIPRVIIGLAMGLLRPVHASLNPLFAALFPVPKIALLALLLLIFGIGETSKYLVIAINVFFLMTLNTYAGVGGIPRSYFRGGTKHYPVPPHRMGNDEASE
ncbi:ABC transporter permease [Neorhizobium galegae]|uniref:ABC transporter permease n=1 Tax=Neorhizobium galegae TaxID=399 RepID=UPI002105D97F|nr:hypothetical protein [Neorhizobium galegae]MCQ1856332.1 hypothetical protein [Neorhizobium galegae]